MKKFFAIFAFCMVFFSSFSGLNRAASLSFNLKATPECGYILLEWEPVTGADRYYIYRGPGEGQEYETPLTDFPIEETTYKDVTDLVVNQKYCYYVKAVNQEGREFLQSTEACAVFTCKEEVPEIGDKDCKLVLKYQVGNYYYWRNENQKGPMDVEPVLLNSRVLASARYLAEEVGAVVSWDNSTKTVKIVTLDGNKIQMQIGNPIMLVNDQQVQIDPNNKAVTPIIYKNRTMLPFRALAYNLGATGPDDIVWLGDIKTAVLTFNDGNCNWICGCYKPYMSPVAAILTYQFYKGCNDAEKMNLNIPPDMKDKLHGWLFAEYIKQFPNQKYWCVEVRVDKDGTVIAWRARPDQYPDCCKPKECKWICGCVKRWTDAPNNHIAITFMPDCNMDSESLTFIVPKTLKDAALGFTLVDYFRQYGNQNYWCMEVCIGPGGTLVQWKATPEKYPECCPKVSDWLCGCVTSVKPPTAATNLNFLYVNFLLECNPTSNTVLTYTIDPTLKDLLLGLTIQEYLAKYPNQEKWCVEVVTQNNKIIHWKATPEKFPDCCKPVVDCKEICGCILKVEPIAGTNGIQVIFSPNCDTTNTINLIMNGNISDSVMNLSVYEYMRKYPDQKYWCAIMCINEKREIIKWKATPEKYPDCCKPVDCKWICGCVRLWTDRSSDSDSNFFEITFDPDCDDDGDSFILSVPITAPDSAYGYTFMEYFRKYKDKKYWCLELCLTEKNYLVSWKATPERYPDCCKPVVECKEVCGCLLSATLISDTKIVIEFAPDCDFTKTEKLIIDKNMLDTKFNYLVTDYIKRYPNQKYWCVVLCMNENKEVVKWTATPEKYPDCCKLPLDCKEVNGYILEVKNIPGTNNTAVIFAPDCDPTKVLNLVMIGNLPDTQFGMTFWMYLEKYPNQKYWCATICLIEDTEIIKWTATPEKYPDCCKQEEDLWVCGCIVSAQATSTGADDNYVNVEISLDCDYEDEDNYTNYEMPEDQLDTNYGYKIFEYLKKYPDHKRWCLEFIAKGKRILKWRASPEKYPDCGNPNVPCKEICGCILAVDPIAGTNTTQVIFSPDCNLANSITLVMTGNLLDTALRIPMETYLAKFPDQKYWCAKVCITANNAIVKWTATPEKYPDCCKETGGRIVAFFPQECIAGTGVLIYNSAGEVVWKGEPNQNGYIDTGCILKCNESYKIFPMSKTCTFTPASQIVKVLCCPETTEVKFNCNCETLTKYCGCIVRMTTDPDINGNYSVYFKKNCASETPAYDLVILFPSTLLDTELGVSVLNYYNSVPGTTPNKYACIEVAVNSAGQAVQWAAFPNRKPCCGEGGGRLVVYLPAKCIKGTTVYVYDIAGAVAWSGTPNAENIIDTGCKLKCSATYIVVAKNPNCTFKPDKQEVKVPCCPEKAEIKLDCTCESDYGRIKITVPSDCAPTTYFTIYDYETGNIALKLSPADYTNGVFDTGCKLPCNRAYKIIPINDKCKLSPESVVVKCPCCPEFGQATFTVNQTESNGRIICYVPGTCVTGTKIVVVDVTGNIIWSGSPNDNGYIDTGCILKCNTTYQVIPKNSDFTFTPEVKEVRLPCCPEKVEIRFECTQKRGRIVVNIPRDCIKGSTIVYVYDQEPTAAIKPIGAIMMGDDLTFDTDCTLACGKAYWVKPFNEQCKFLPEYQKVIPVCCPQYSQVDFKCDCSSTKGRIVVNIPRICLQSSTLVYLFDVEPSATTKPIGAIMMGDDLTFDTDCTLVCNKAYWLKPQNEKCKFFPEVMKVVPPCCPEYASVAFKCECESEKARIRISLPKNCIEGTKVLIYEGTSNLVATLTVNDMGYYDTNCTLKCDTYYTIIPKNEKCTFYPASQYIQTVCCPEVTNVAFKCECESANARIIITVPTICSANTTVYVYEGEYSPNKRAVLSLNPDRSGKCDTGCVLKCNTLYTIVPKNTQCTFYPATMPVKTTCCPEATTVGFKCECEGPGSVPPGEEPSTPIRQPRCVFHKEENLI